MCFPWEVIETFQLVLYLPNSILFRSMLSKPEVNSASKICNSNLYSVIIMWQSQILVVQVIVSFIGLLKSRNYIQSVACIDSCVLKDDTLSFGASSYFIYF